MKDLIWSGLRMRRSSVEFVDTAEGFTFQATPARSDTPTNVTFAEIEAAEDIGVLCAAKLVEAGF